MSTEARLPDDMTPLLTAVQVGLLLQCSHDTVNDLTRTDGLPYVPVGRRKRYRREAVLEWIESRQRRKEVPRPVPADPPPPPRRGRPKKGSEAVPSWRTQIMAVAKAKG